MWHINPIKVSIGYQISDKNITRSPLLSSWFKEGLPYKQNSKLFGNLICVIKSWLDYKIVTSGLLGTWGDEVEHFEYLILESPSWEKHITTCFNHTPVGQPRTWIQGNTQGDMHHIIYQNFCENYLKDGIPEKQARLGRPHKSTSTEDNPLVRLS